MVLKSRSSSAMQRHSSAFPMFLRRLLRPNQMDYECAICSNDATCVEVCNYSPCLTPVDFCRFTLWLMVQLVVSPKTACAPVCLACFMTAAASCAGHMPCK